MPNHTVVLAIFNDEMSADEAAALLKESRLAKGDAIGVLALDEKGELKAEKVGKRSWGKGGGIGAVVALVTPVGLAAGLIGGGLLGALHHKNLGLSDADRERLHRELEGGKAAVGVLAPVAEAAVVADFLEGAGWHPGGPSCLRRGGRGSPDGRNCGPVLTVIFRSRGGAHGHGVHVRQGGKESGERLAAAAGSRSNASSPLALLSIPAVNRGS